MSRNSQVPGALAEVRSSFIDYFATRGHQIVPSGPLIPPNDRSLLFSNCGMVQFKDVFSGREVRSYDRAASCQKCLRISGKHNDFEEVGYTKRHHTFFEMLGNFSFGAYFKSEAISFAWDYLTTVLQFDSSRLWVSVYKDDIETAELWQKLTGISQDRIVFFGEADNFWSMGDTGPCGPCSEVFYQRGELVATQNVNTLPESCTELWNIVFMQYERDSAGNLSSLPVPCIDTGMGLERIAAVLQDVPSTYDTDLFRSLISLCENLSNQRYEGAVYGEIGRVSNPQQLIDIAMRVVVDHVRAAVFLVSEGVEPGSSGHSYVLRRLIRRAMRFRKGLGIEVPCLKVIGSGVVNLMGHAYPELYKQQERVALVLEQEEQRFEKTLNRGLSYLEKKLNLLVSGEILSGSTVFQLHDSLGFPLELTRDILLHRGVDFDQTEFNRLFEDQRNRSSQ